MNEGLRKRFLYPPARQLTAVWWALCAVAVAATPVYQVTDEDGNVLFTDQPAAVDAESAEQLTIRPLNTAEPPPAATPDEPKPTPAAMIIPFETRIEQPAHGSTIPMGPGAFTVTVSISPPLTDSEHLQLEMDGAPYGPPQTQHQWSLTNIYRGAHQLRVQRLQNSGAQLDVSDASTVFVLRPSVAR
jgi:hypothetical protein